MCMCMRVCIAFFRLSYLHCRPGDGKACNVCPLVLQWRSQAASPPSQSGPEIMFLPKCIFIRHVSPAPCTAMHACGSTAHRSRLPTNQPTNQPATHPSKHPTIYVVGAMHSYLINVWTTLLVWVACCTFFVWHVADAAALILIDAFSGPITHPQKHTHNAGHVIARVLLQTVQFGNLSKRCPTAD